MNEEVERIINLPTRVLHAGDLSAKYRRPGSDATLFPIQSQALDEIKRVRGLLAPIGVGEGKTLICFLAAKAAGVKNALLMVPASVYPQTIEMYADGKIDWMIPQLLFLTYSKLSVASGAFVLDRLRPDLIIADECHMLKRANSARTMRVIRYFQENPSTRFVGLSGTITANSLKDYAHLAELALREYSPLPREKYSLESWARVIDPNDKPLNQDWAAVRPLVRWANMIGSTQTIAREAFQKRLRGTLGVVCSAPDKLGTSLQIIIHRDFSYPDFLYEQTKEDKTRPDGMVFESDIEEWRCLRQLSLGFFYKWDWGEREPDDEWVENKNNWGRNVRYELKSHAAKGYDSPLLVSRKIEETGVDDGSLTDAWYDWLSVKDRKPPDTVPQWEDDSIFEEVLQLKKETGGKAFLWYDSKAVAEQLEQYSDVHVVHAGEEPPKSWDLTPFVALSISSHGQGWNLQAFNQNIVLEPPANGQAWEQMIGRTHRRGQKKDTVYVHVLAHTPIFRQALKRAREHAKYIEETTGTRQRLCYADYVEAE